MKTKRKQGSKIKIDASMHKPAPTFGQRVKYTALSVFYGIVIAQMLLFITLLFRFGDQVFIYNYKDEPLFYAYLAVCLFFGWRRGEDFAGWLEDKIDRFTP